MTDSRPPADQPHLTFLAANDTDNMRGRIARHDWSSTPLGAMSAWPVSLTTMVQFILDAAQPMLLWWGSELIQLYNDAYVPSFGKRRHPAALGQGAQACWSEIWPIVEPQLNQIYAGKSTDLYDDHLLMILRDGHLTETYWTYSYSPVRDEFGAIAGVVVISTETTARVQAARRQRTLDLLRQRMARCTSVADISHHLAELCALCRDDLLDVVETVAAAGMVDDGAMTFSARDLGADIDYILRFKTPAHLQKDAQYRHFLEQFTITVAAARQRIDSDANQMIVVAERDRLLLDAPVGAAVMVGDDLKYHLVNSLYAEVSGRPASAMVGKSFVSVFPELIGSPVHRRFMSVYQAGTPFVSDETLVQIHRHGGVLEDRYFTYNLSPLRNLAGHVYGLMVIAVDITHQVEARTQVERLNTELNAAARAKDEFLALLGHELRNPLAPIVTALDLMRLRDQATAREQVIIRRQVKHLTRLVDDLLDVSRITRGKVELRKETVSIREVVSRAVEMVGALISDKEQTLSTDVQDSYWHGDPARLAQVVSNLLTNAARYGNVGGKIALESHSAQGWLVLTVTDDGMGVSPALLPRLFDAFVQGERQLNNAIGGLGIGLALVKNLVELHGGTVTAYSDGPGRGSCFTVMLPVAEQLTAAPEVAMPSPDSDRPTAAARILVVDDNRDAADSLAALLRSLGHTVLVAYEPFSALHLASGQPFDIALLDIGLPGMSGHDLAGILRTSGKPPSKFVALTGYGQEVDAARSAKAGFDLHLVKPVAIEQLQAIFY